MGGGGQHLAGGRKVGLARRRAARKTMRVVVRDVMEWNAMINEWRGLGAIFRALGFQCNSRDALVKFRGFPFPYPPFPLSPSPYLVL